MRNKYTITFKGKTKNLALTVAYGESGSLCAIDFADNDNERSALEYIIARIPLVEQELANLGYLALIEQVPTDLSFAAFWEAYGYKIGDKTRTMKLWTALTDADRVKCLRSISKYNQFLRQRPSMERLYPETYLKQERYKNEFKV